MHAQPAPALCKSNPKSLDDLLSRKRRAISRSSLRATFAGLLLIEETPLSVRRQTAVERNRRAGEPRGFLRREKHGQRSELFRLPHSPQRNLRGPQTHGSFAVRSLRQNRLDKIGLDRRRTQPVAAD